MCIVYRKANGINTYVGGASLIARNKVLTVAHKFLVKTSKVDEDIVFSPDIYVRCGEHDVKLTTEFLQSQESRVLSVHLHPDYDKKNIFNNLAILETESNFIYQKHIGPVCLPSPGERFEGLTDCISTGWGADAQQSTNPNAVYSDVLKKVTLPVMRSRDQCAVDISAIPRFV
ncbi:ovochymase-2 [Eurytemora carolleeae]|uniref:ovochymase-2 n=1 Tax=Eurytemora carolleeae TaxID=1294199 RepID=UPI000C7841AE|nr:ovochymase-2 [Eurytemora carolleeae]|eukprot:XP_023338488.1 ovochymase-2-like [Eurytemora affinis]